MKRLIWLILLGSAFAQTSTSTQTQSAGSGTNTGTITGVTASTGLSGGGSSGSVSLSVTNPVVPIPQGRSSSGNATGTNVVASNARLNDCGSWAIGLSAGSDYGAAIANCVTEATLLGIGVDISGLPEEFSCATPMIPIGGGFAGEFKAGNHVVFVSGNTNACQFAIPPHVHVVGPGWSGGANYTVGQGFVIEPCGPETASGDFTAYCASTNFTPVAATGDNNSDFVPLGCFSNDLTNGCKSGNTAAQTATGTAFDSTIYGMQFDAGGIANMYLFANYYFQEGLRIEHVKFANVCGANSVGLDFGASYGGAQNGLAYDLQFAVGNATCVNSASAVPMRIATQNATNGNPNIISKFSVVNNSSLGTVPNYCVEIVGGTKSGLNIGPGHLESCKYGIAQGVTTIAGVDTGSTSNGVVINNMDCGPNMGTACFKMFTAATLASAAVTNATIVYSRQTGTATNTVQDDAAIAIPASCLYIQEYRTAAVGTVLADTCGFNPTNQPGFMQSMGAGPTGITQNEAWRTANYTNATTTATTFISYTFPALAHHYSGHCGGVWHEAGTTDGIVLSVIFSTAPTNAAVKAEACNSNATNIAVCSKGGKSGIAVNTTQALVTTGAANASGVEYPIDIDFGVEVAVGGTTMSLQAAETAGTTGLTIARNFYCAIQP